MTTVDAMADEIMKGLTDYADLADEAMKKTVRKTAKSVKDKISANAPKRTGAYSKSWTVKKTGENSHSLEMTVHSKITCQSSNSRCCLRNSSTLSQIFQCKIGRASCRERV